MEPLPELPCKHSQTGPIQDLYGQALTECTGSVWASPLTQQGLYRCTYKSVKMHLEPVQDL